MGRDKARKPRKSKGERETPRIVDMVGVPPDVKKNVVVSSITNDGDQIWQSLQALVARKYGEFTVEERDILDLPRQARHEAFRDLEFYAAAQIPPQAPISAREAAARTAANCQQALRRLLPLIQQTILRDPEGT